MRLEYRERLALGFIASGCLLGALLGALSTLIPARGERRAHHR